MVSVSDLLQAKRGVWTVSPDASVFEALELMASKDVGALPVVERGRLVGIFSERDYARKIILKGKTSRQTTVRELMTSPVVCIRPEDTISDCMELMTHRRVRHLPVLEGDRLVGIVTIGDVVKQVISEQESTIEHLANYIQGCL